MYRIMLVDDEPNILSALRRSLHAIDPDLLGGHELEIEFSDTPEKALRRANRAAFDLVISDYRMPSMNGVEFLKALIAIQPNVARLVLSGYADLDAVVAAVNQTQIYRFIGKPWDDYDLRATVVQALRHRDLLTENQRLADRVRVQQNQLTRQEVALRQLAERSPGLAAVRRDIDGAILIDAEDAEVEGVEANWMH